MGCWKRYCDDACVLTDALGQLEGEERSGSVTMVKIEETKEVGTTEGDETFTA